jgi:two-component system, OmpR family, phosphate regulon sensor histidine kinase PhoR
VKLGIHGRLFALALGVIAVAMTTMSAYVWGELRDTIEERLARDLEVRAELVARQVERAPADGDWQSLAGQLGKAAQCRVTLLAADGNVRGDSELTLEQLGRAENQAHRAEVRRAMETGRIAAAPTAAGGHHPFLFVAAPVSSPSVRIVRLTQSVVPVQAAARRAEHLMWLGAMVALGAAALLTAAWSRVVSQSIRQLRTSAVAMLDDLSVRTRIRRPDDVGSLAEALDQLADNLNRTVEKLGSERDRLAGIVETMAEGVLLTDGTGRIVLANGSLRMMVASSGQLVGKEPIEAIRNHELAEMIETVQRSKGPAVGEVELIGILPRRVLVRAAPLTVSGADRDERAPSEGVVVVLSDVTELRRLETLRRDFVANVSHELRTPIAAIRAAAETLEAGAIDDPHAARDFIGMIGRHAERLHQLVEDLLELSRIEAQKLDLQATPIEARELIDHMIALYALSAERREVALAAGPCPPDLMLSTDRRALEQILSNLIDNAIKYASRGVKVTLSAAAKDGEVRIAVVDTGAGIAARHLPRLFERFYRVDRGRSRDVGGTGLGLSIVKHLTEALGGHVTVESVPGVGSTFTVIFPAKLAGSTPAPPDETRSSPDAGLTH